ncbi:potassium channel family protein [Leifsonia shinshuensis]|uniref:potassium channel family protein n=1 Tax=Leifsonia shinshuensis TaxID=150026 RepID=UPI001F514F48|nr:potassium channel family protein [Leifsonia shinshuensis]MCI0155448.1 potassium channel family protein [Leifsonia shinshuensis]
MTLERWRHLTEWPLTAAAAVFLVAYAWEVIADLHGPQLFAAETVIWATWCVFLVDYAVCLVLAPHRWRWFYTHLFDLAIVVLPMLRPLRLLRLVTILAILQRSAGTAFRGRVLVYVAGAGSLLVFTAALAALDAERGAPHAHIETFPQAVWWAFETISTVGYGDYTPVTDVGRLVAVGLMIGGIATLGIVTATLASWIVDRVAQTEIDTRSATRGQIHDLSAQVAELKALLEKKSA